MTALDERLGMVAVAPGVVALPACAGLGNHHGGVHGAALAALLAAAAESAAGAQGDARAAARVRSLQVQYLRPAQGPLRAQARITGGGQTLCFCAAEVHDDRGRAVAQALATLSLR